MGHAGLVEGERIGSAGAQLIYGLFVGVSETLFDRQYIEKQKRQIGSTPTARALIRALPDVATQRYSSPTMVAGARASTRLLLSLDAIFHDA